MVDLRAAAHGWDRDAWCLAALTLVLTQHDDDDGTHAAALELIDALGLADAVRAIPSDARAGFAGQTRAPLLQTAALLTRDAAWMEQPDDALIAQGRASAQGVPMFAQHVLPELTGLAERFAEPGARMLDVGTGVAALAVAYAEYFPNLHVVGLDVMPRVLRLAQTTIAASSAADRVVAREQDVAQLDEDAAYDLVWLPAPFIPETPLREAVPRMARALRPGGWFMIGHGKYGSDPVDDAVSRLKTVAFGGTALDNPAADRLLTDAGLVEVRTLATPPGTPALTVGRRLQ